VFGYRTITVKENLDLAFPDKTELEKKKIRKKFYHHLCDLILESIKSMTISESEMKKRYVFTNVEEIHKLEKENKSIVLMCGHYASWEWIFIIQKYISHKGYGIYKKLANKYFDRLVKRIRARYNTYLITTKETISVLTESKQKGELSISGFASDQSPKANKAYHWNEFMGIKVPIHTGAEMIAKKLDMAVVFFAVKKIKRGYYETTFKTLCVNPNEFENYKITDMFMKLVEKQIHEDPQYYLWTHKRWKHRDKVPEEYK
jgi:KDO2-lipid IV(A) lauroyltransferase